MAAPGGVSWLFHAAFWVPLVICTYLALIPEPPENPVFKLSDVLLHGAAFAYLTLALILARYREISRRLALYTRAFLLMLAYGVFLELAQSQIPERTAELKDILVDVAGILLGLGLATLLAGPIHELTRRIWARM